MNSTDKLRVLQVVSYYPPDRIGGVGEVAAHLHQGLLVAGHDSSVVTTGTSHGDTSVHRVSSGPTSFPFSSIKYLTKAGQAQVVHFHHGEALGLMIGLKLLSLFRLKSNPLIITTFHVNPMELAKSMRPFRLDGKKLGIGEQSFFRGSISVVFRYLADRLALWLSDQSSFISRSAAVDTIGQEKAVSAKVIYNSVPEFTESPDTTIGPEHTDLLYVGTYNTRKRVVLLPIILEEVRRSKPEATLRIIGFDLQDFPDLRSDFNERGLLGAIRAEGKKRSGELPEFYRASKLLIVPSSYEGLPMVIMEGFRCGLPCVATNVSGHPEIIEHGVNGFLCGIDKPREMAKLAVQILDDDVLRDAMSLQARDTMRKSFGLEKQVSGYLNFYHECLSLGQR